MLIAFWTTGPRYIYNYFSHKLYTPYSKHTQIFFGFLLLFFSLIRFKNMCPTKLWHKWVVYQDYDFRQSYPCLHFILNSLTFCFNFFFMTFPVHFMIVVSEFNTMMVSFPFFLKKLLLPIINDFTPLLISSQGQNSGIS